MPQFLEPPPTYIKEFNWHWAQWFNKVFESLSFRGGLIYTPNSGADITGLSTTAGAYTPHNFEEVVFDTYQMYDPLGGTGSDDVVRVPSGVQRMRFTYIVFVDVDTAGSTEVKLSGGVLINAGQTSGLWTESSADIRPGGPISASRFGSASGTTSGIILGITVQSGVINVQEGDVFSFGARYDVITGSVTASKIEPSLGRGFFAWEIIE